VHFFSAFRTLGRIALGKRPRQQDLDRIVRDLRSRLARGKSIRRPKIGFGSSAAAERRLRAFQLRKLKRTVAYAYKHVPYYRRTLNAAGIRPADIKTLADFRRLPITHRTDLQSQRDDFISRAPGLSAAMHMTTGGTTGKPIEILLTPEELDCYVSIQAISGMLYNFLGPKHIVQVHLPLEASINAQISSAAAQVSGALVMNLGVSGSLDEHLDSILKTQTIPGKFSKVSDVYAAPGYFWALTARAEQRGLDCKQSGLRRLFTGGATVSPALKQRVKQTWGVPLYEAYSMTEILPTAAIECDHGRLHFLDASGLVEFLDPETQLPVKPGEPGIAVFTTFYPDRELMPVLRYWSKDLMIPSTSPCPCGNVATGIDKILGRPDQMIVIGTENFYPQPIGDVLTSFRELVQPPRFHVRTEERADAYSVVVEVECAETLADTAAKELAKKIQEILPINTSAHVVAGIVKTEVYLVPAGSIQKPFRYKLQGPKPR
jgi:phenylacetate-CoA ligase